MVAAIPRPTMRHHVVPALAILCLVSAAPLRAALNASAGLVNRAALSVQGVSCPEVTAWTGGEIRAEVVEEKGAAATSPRKHLGAIRYEPIVIEAGLPLSQPLLDCVADLCANRSRGVALGLGTLDQNYNPSGKGLQANNAQLVEIRFREIDAGSQDAAKVTLIFVADSTQVTASGPAVDRPALSGPSKSKRAVSGNFRLTMPGLTTNTVTRIDEFAITRRMVQDAIGSAREPVKIAATTEFPHLTVTMRSPAPADWEAWRDSFLIKGNSADSQEKSGAIEFLSPDLQTVLCSIQLSHAGIFRFSEPPGEPNSLRVAQASIYVEGISVANSPASVATPKGQATTTPPAITTPATRSVVSEVAPTTAATTTTPSPAATEPAVAQTTTITAAPDAASTVTSPEDQGARDPADFPRPEKTVRTLFTSVRQKTSVQETAKYTTPQTSGDLVAFYEASLGGSGWEVGTRYENNYGTRGAHQILSVWTKENRTANLTLIDLEPGKTEIQVIVQAKL
jgi:hypothetical protein